MDILDEKSVANLIKNLGSNIEALILVDENDKPYRNTSGQWSSEFRQDCEQYDILPESKERPIIKRVALFILEDTTGNIVVSRRSTNKSHPNMLEIPGGHVAVGYSYLETCVKELKEELGYELNNLSESDRLFKFRSTVPDQKPGTRGRGIIMTTYRVNIPDKSNLKYDTNEIAELITMTPERLFHAVQNKDPHHQFDVNHAYLYLEYLRKRFPENNEKIVQEQEKLTHTLTPLGTFLNEENYRKTTEMLIPEAVQRDIWHAKILYKKKIFHEAGAIYLRLAKNGYSEALKMAVECADMLAYHEEEYAAGWLYTKIAEISGVSETGEK